MAKVTIINENIKSFGGIYYVMDVFSKLGFEKLTETVVGKRGSSGKAYSYGSIFASHGSATLPTAKSSRSPTSTSMGLSRPWWLTDTCQLSVCQ